MHPCMLNYIAFAFQRSLELWVVFTRANEKAGSHSCSESVSVFSRPSEEAHFSWCFGPKNGMHVSLWYKVECTVLLIKCSIQ